MSAEPHLVYVVDDEASVRRSLGRLLTSNGLRRREFASGRELLADERCAEATCFVVDIYMEEMNGYELAKRLEIVAAGSPVILMTARAEESTRWRKEAPAAVALLIKPFSEQELVAVLEQALG